MNINYKQIMVILCCVFSIMVAGCGVASLPEALEDVARDNGKYSNVIITNKGTYYDVLLNCTDSPSEKKCDDLAVKLLRTAYSSTYKDMKFQSIKVSIGEDVTNAFHGNTYFDPIASYELSRLNIKNIDLSNITDEELVKLAHKNYRKPQSDISRINTKDYKDIKREYGIQ